MLGPSSERSVTKSAQSVRSGVYTAEKMLQEEAVIFTGGGCDCGCPKAGRSISNCFFEIKKKKKVLFCTGTNPECFTFFFSSLKLKCHPTIPFGLKILGFSIPPGHCARPPKHAVTYPYFFGMSYAWPSWQ